MGYTPMMQQYFEVKDQYKDFILMYRLGDFYEMFFEDAYTASRELELTLTGRDCGMEERAPMCGVPFHKADVYIGRLVEKGYKVAVCEQMEDPALAKGLVKREVIKIVTPGTVTDTALLSDKQNNFLAAVYLSRRNFCRRRLCRHHDRADLRHGLCRRGARHPPEESTGVLCAA